MGDIVTRLGIDDFEIAALSDHRGQPVQRNITAALGVVESPVRVLLDRYLVGRLGHHLELLKNWPSLPPALPRCNNMSFRSCEGKVVQAEPNPRVFHARGMGIALCVER